MILVYDLRAILSLKDSNFSSGMKNAERITRTTQKAMDDLTKSTNHTRGANGKLRDSMGRFVGGSGKMVGSIGKLRSGLGGLIGTLGAVGAAYAAIETSKKVFESTVLEAAKFEQSNIVIGAMFDDKKLTKQYTDMLDKLAIDSPILDSQSVFGNSKSYIQVTKNVDQLEKMWGLTERLMSANPDKNIDEAVRAIKELSTGDSQSIVEMFELDRGVMNQIKKLPLKQQMTELDKYFSKIGLTTKLIDDMGKSTLGVWAQVQEKFQKVLRGMGEPALQTLSKFLNNALDRLGGKDIKRFANIGAKWIDNILTGLTDSAIKVYDWFSVLTASEEFKEKTTLAAKVNFVINDVFEKFSDWMKDTGKNQLTKASAFLMEVLAGGLAANQEPVIKIARDIGVAIGKALGTAASEELKSYIDGMLKDIMKIPGLSGVGIGGTIGRSVSDFITKDDKKVSDTTEKATPKKKSVNTTNTVIRIQPKLPVRGSYNAGTDRIHSDGLYRLHKDEAVLNRGKADQYRNGGGIGGITIAKLADQIIIREEADIDRIADQLVRNIIKSAGAGA